MRILIAQHNALARLTLARVLEEWGYDVTATMDTAEAADALLAADAPRLAVLDWEVSGLDGLELCRRVRARETLQPPYIILLTDLGDKESVVAGLDAGADDYVGKPYHPAELRARLEVGHRLVELNDELHAAQVALRIQACTDSLTGVLNRGAVYEGLVQEIARAERRGAGLGLALFDVDHFKQVNDTLGHPAGDAVLRALVQRVEHVLRPYDSLGRFGGEEFLVVLPSVDERQLREVLERVRRSVAKAPITAGGHRVGITVSLGGAVRTRESADELIARVDEALYVAKNAGRDRVVLADSGGGAVGG